MVVQGLRMSFRYDNVLVKGIIRLIEWFMLNLSDIIIANSKYISKYIEKLTLSDKAIVIAHPGLEMDCDFQPTNSHANSERISILYVGECAKVKGLIFLVEAMSYLKDKNIHLLAGPLHNRVPGPQPRRHCSSMSKVSWSKPGEIHCHARAVENAG